MALPSNSETTYLGANSNREDLIDKIFMVAQEQTPFTSAISKGKATATLHEWQTEDLAAAIDTNAVLEGDDATTDAPSNTVRRTNYTQISDKVARVTGTQQAVQHAGKTSEMAHQVAIKMTELKRDIEKSALANKAKVAGNASTARVAAGVESWVATNVSEGSGATSATGDGTDARVAGTLRAYTETLLKGVIADCADAGATPNLVMVGSTNKQAMSAFTGNSDRNIDATMQTLNAAIDIYVSDFGRLQVVYSPQSNASSALVLDTQMWSLCTLGDRSFKQNALAKTGDTERTQIITEWTLQCDNEKGNGAIYDLTK